MGHNHRAAGACPCSACHYFAGWTAQGTAAECIHPACCRVRSGPEDGCSCWEREPGADGELILPPSPRQTWFSWEQARRCVAH